MTEQQLINMETFKVVTKAITESDDLEIMAQHMCHLLVGSLDVKGCTIFLLSHHQTTLEPLASFGLSKQYLRKGALDPSKSLDETKKKEPTIIRDTEKEQGLQYPEHAQKEGIRSILGIPIIFALEPIGAFRLYHHMPWDIGDQDVDSLFVLGEVMGMAIQYATAVNSLRHIKHSLDILPFLLE
ncbi:MAG: GAF domain-containing protein [Desulfohalobiaceae bacterium]